MFLKFAIFSSIKDNQSSAKQEKSCKVLVTYKALMSITKLGCVRQNDALWDTIYYCRFLGIEDNINYWTHVSKN